MEVIKGAVIESEELLPGVFKSPRVKTEGLEVLMLTLEPGSALQPHDMPCQVAFFVLEGEGTFTYGEKVATVGPADMIHAKPGMLRFWANRTSVTLKLLVIKSLAEK